jgi:nucleotide-binding universal stress UspA family protein
MAARTPVNVELQSRMMVQIRRLLLPTDFSESARHALGYALSLASVYKAEILLLHVVELLPSGYAGELFPSAMGQVVDEVRGYAQAELAKLADEARRQGASVREQIVEGRAATEILRVAQEEQIDAVVIGTHGRGALSHALFGSTTDRVVRKAPCPVLICRMPHHHKPA